MRRIFVAILLSFLCNFSFAQFPGGSPRGFGGQQMNVGHFYGKVVDSKTNSPIEFAAVQLFQNKFDSVTKAMKQSMVGGELSKTNGDFSLENLPVMGEFTLKISALGYSPYEQKLSFNLKFGQGGGMQQAMNA